MGFSMGEASMDDPHSVAAAMMPHQSERCPLEDRTTDEAVPPHTEKSVVIPLTEATLPLDREPSFTLGTSFKSTIKQFQHVFNTQLSIWKHNLLNWTKVYNDTEITILPGAPVYLLGKVYALKCREPPPEGSMAYETTLLAPTLYPIQPLAKKTTQQTERWDARATKALPSVTAKNSLLDESGFISEKEGGGVSDKNTLFYVNSEPKLLRHRTLSEFLFDTSRAVGSLSDTGSDNSSEASDAYASSSSQTRDAFKFRVEEAAHFLSYKYSGGYQGFDKDDVEEKFRDAFGSITQMTYRTGFKPLYRCTTENGNKREWLAIHSDVGWGCAIRAGQMLLIQILKQHFLEQPVEQPKLQSHVGSFLPRQHYCISETELIENFLDIPNPPNRCPFSVYGFVRAAGGGAGWAKELYGDICVEKELFGDLSPSDNVMNRRGIGKFAGEWFGPTTVSFAVKLLVEKYAFTASELYVYVNTEGLVNVSEIHTHCMRPAKASAAVSKPFVSSSSSLLQTSASLCAQSARFLAHKRIEEDATVSNEMDAAPHVQTMDFKASPKLEEDWESIDFMPFEAIEVIEKAPMATIPTATSVQETHTGGLEAQREGCGSLACGEPYAAMLQMDSGTTAPATPIASSPYGTNRVTTDAQPYWDSTMATGEEGDRGVATRGRTATPIKELECFMHPTHRDPLTLDATQAAHASLIADTSSKAEANGADLTECTPLQHSPDSKCASGGIWKRGCILLFPLTLSATDHINPIYYNSILAYLELPWVAGFIGGRGTEAFYCVGKQNESILYLDPHSNIQAAAWDVHADYSTFYGAKPLKIPISVLNPSVSLAFYCRDESDFYGLTNAILDISDKNMNALLDIAQNRKTRMRSEQLQNIHSPSVSSVIALDSDFCEQSSTTSIVGDRKNSSDDFVEVMPIEERRDGSTEIYEEIQAVRGKLLQ